MSVACAHIDKYKLQERFDRCKTVAGIRSHHCFIPTSSNCISMKRVSEDDTPQLGLEPHRRLC